MNNPINFQQLKTLMSNPSTTEQLFNNKIMGGLFTQKVQDIELGDDQITCTYVMSGKTQLKVTFAKKQDGNTSVIVNNNWNWTYFVVFLVSLKWFIVGDIAAGIFALFGGILVLFIFIKVFGNMIFGKHQRTIEERISSRISNIS
jgi:hypothetical protein